MFYFMNICTIVFLCLSLFCANEELLGEYFTFPEFPQPFSKYTYIYICYELSLLNLALGEMHNTVEVMKLLFMWICVFRSFLCTVFWRWLSKSAATTVHLLLCSPANAQRFQSEYSSCLITNVSCNTMYMHI